MTEEHVHDENCNHEQDEGIEFEHLPPEIQVAHLTMTLLQMTKEAAHLVAMIEEITGLHNAPALDEGQETLDKWTPDEEE